MTTTPYRTGTSVLTGTDVLTGQEVEQLVRCRISFDDLDVPDADLTWVDFTDKVKSWDVQGGRESELDEMDAYVAKVVLDDRTRQLDPTNSSSPYAGNLVPNRRLLLTMETNSQEYPLFRGYIDTFGPTYPLGSEWSNTEANIQATDGNKVLAKDTLPPANPDVLDYDEVIDDGSPSYYYRLGEPAGTKMVAKTRKVRVRKHHKWVTRKKKFKVAETIAPVDGVSGPSGTYQATPTLAQPGAITGDPDTSVLFDSNSSEFARVSLDQGDFAGVKLLSISVWFKQRISQGAANMVAGPYKASIGDHIFAAYVKPPVGATSGQVGVKCNLTGSGFSNTWIDTSEYLVGEWHHLGWAIDFLNGHKTLVFDGQVIVDGSISPGDTMETGDASEYLYIGRNRQASNEPYFDGWIDEVAVYEVALTADQLVAHYEAASLGIEDATVDERISEVLDLIPNFDLPVRSLQTSSTQLERRRTAGVDPKDLILDAIAAEGAPSLFFFTKTGIPTFLNSGYRSVAPYNAPQFTFDSDGTDIPYEELALSDEDAFLYNDIRITTVEGKSVRVKDDTSIDRFGRSVLQIDSVEMTEAAASTLATSLLVKYKNPMVRIASFTLNGRDVSARNALLSMELGSAQRVIWRPKNGSIFDQSSYVEKVHLWQNEGDTVMGEFAISPR